MNKITTSDADGNIFIDFSKIDLTDIGDCKDVTEYFVNILTEHLWLYEQLGDFSHLHELVQKDTCQNKEISLTKCICGSTNIHTYTKSNSGVVHGYECKNCGMKAKQAKTDTEARKQWNKEVKEFLAEIGDVSGYYPKAI